MAVNCGKNARSWVNCGKNAGWWLYCGKNAGWWLNCGKNAGWWLNCGKNAGGQTNYLLREHCYYLNIFVIIVHLLSWEKQSFRIFSFLKKLVIL